MEDRLCDHDDKDNSFKYVMMDTGHIYIGARYSYAELMEEDAVPFKLKTILSRYVLPETEAGTTLDNQLYHLENDSLLYGIFKQLRLKVKIVLPVEKKGRTGRTDRRYKEKVLTLDQLSSLSPEQKKTVLIHEMIVTRLGLMSFSV